MKTSVALCALILASTGYAANAAQLSDYADIDVVSVVPRSPDVKPLVMAIFTKEQLQRASAAAFKRSAFADKSQNR